MAKDKKKKSEDKTKKSDFKAFLRKRAPIYLGLIALFVVFVIPEFTKGDLESSMPELTAEKQQVTGVAPLVWLYRKITGATQQQQQQQCKGKTSKHAARDDVDDRQGYAPSSVKAKSHFRIVSNSNIKNHQSLITNANMSIVKNKQGGYWLV